MYSWHETKKKKVFFSFWQRSETLLSYLSLSLQVVKVLRSIQSPPSPSPLSPLPSKDLNLPIIIWFSSSVSLSLSLFRNTQKTASLKVCVRGKVQVLPFFSFLSFFSLSLFVRLTAALWRCTTRVCVCSMRKWWRKWRAWRKRKKDLRGGAGGGAINQGKRKKEADLLMHSPTEAIANWGRDGVTHKRASALSWALKRKVFLGTANEHL